MREMLQNMKDVISRRVLLNIPRTLHFENVFMLANRLNSKKI